MRPLGSVLATGGSLALAGAVAVHTFLPASSVNTTVSTLPLIAHGLAFPLVGGVCLVVTGAGWWAALTMRRGGGAGGHRPARGIPATSLMLAGLLLWLSTSAVALPTAPRSVAAGPGTSLVVVSWNALDHFDETSAEQIFGVLGADVAVLPELGDGVGGGASRVREALARAGFEAGDYDIVESPPTGTHIAPVTVVVRRTVGSYSHTAVQQTTFGTVHLVAPHGSGLPDILAVHTAPPVPRWMGEWRADLRGVRDLADSIGATAIIAGDLNATARHGGLGAITTHAGVLGTVPATQRGTWPSGAWQVLRSGIDHVLVPVDSWAVVEARTVEIQGSDHAAVATTIVSTS